MDDDDNYGAWYSVVMVVGKEEEDKGEGRGVRCWMEAEQDGEGFELVMMVVCFGLGETKELG